MAEDNQRSKMGNRSSRGGAIGSDVPVRDVVDGRRKVMQYWSGDPPRCHTSTKFKLSIVSQVIDYPFSLAWLAIRITLLTYPSSVQTTWIKFIWFLQCTSRKQSESWVTLGTFIKRMVVVITANEQVFTGRFRNINSRGERSRFRVPVPFWVTTSVLLCYYIDIYLHYLSS